LVYILNLENNVVHNIELQIFLMPSKTVTLLRNKNIRKSENIALEKLQQ